MTTTAAGRGGTPPRPAGPPAPRPAQWFIFGPWLYDVQLAMRLLAETPRPARRLPVAAWAHAYGLDREPGADPHTIALIGPGPGFDPACAMDTNLAQPVLVATLAPAGQPPAPLLIDGAHRLYKAHALGVAELPGWVLTAAETMAIRCPSRPRPARTRAAPGPPLEAPDERDHGHDLAQRTYRPRRAAPGHARRLHPG